MRVAMMLLGAFLLAGCTTDGENGASDDSPMPEEPPREMPETSWASSGEGNPPGKTWTLISIDRPASWADTSVQGNDSCSTSSGDMNPGGKITCSRDGWMALVWTPTNEFMISGTA